MQTLIREFYKVGDIVAESGMYLCVPCGYTQYFQVGMVFTTCLACLAGTENGPPEYRDSDKEFWQFIG